MRRVGLPQEPNHADKYAYTDSPWRLIRSAFRAARECPVNPLRSRSVCWQLQRAMAAPDLRFFEVRMFSLELLHVSSFGTGQIRAAALPQQEFKALVQQNQNRFAAHFY